MIRMYNTEPVTILLAAVPIRSRTYFTEWFCACLFSPEDWITRGISAICREKYWKLTAQKNNRPIQFDNLLVSPGMSDQSSPGLQNKKNGL